MFFLSSKMSEMINDPAFHSCDLCYSFSCSLLNLSLPLILEGSQLDEPGILN